MTDLFAGLDVSTQSCKLVVIDGVANEVVHVDAVNYDRDLPEFGTRNGVIADAPDGVSEADPTMWIAAVDRVFEGLKTATVPIEQIRSISVSGQQHGLVALDASGELARPRSKLWNDYSTSEECEILTESVGGRDAMIAEVGNTQRPGYTAAKILHMRRHEPERYEAAETLFLVHNYVNAYLTGGVRVMEPGDTSGMALWNPRTGRWSDAVIDAIDPGLRQKLPPVQPADRSIGSVSASWVERFGFSRTCTVDAGSGDNMYGAVGTGNVTPGLVTISLGTSGTAYSYVEDPFVDPEGEIAAFCDSTGHYLPLLCVSNLANGYDELLRVHRLSHEEFETLVGETPPGNDGRVLIPWFAGERTPDLPDAAPLYFGFQLDSLTPKTLCRAVLEGHVLNLWSGFRRMPVTARELRVTGGLARSDAWCQTIADVFEVEVVPVEGEGAALGAAIHAAWVWRKEQQRDDCSVGDVAAPFIVLDERRRKRPNPASSSAYQIQKRLFEAVSRRIRGLDGEDPFVLRLHGG